MLSTKAPAAVDAAELPRRARALVPLLSERAEAAEQQGALTDDVVAAFHRDGLFAMWVPRSVGGAELDPLRSLEVLESLASGDPSAGWVLMAAAIATGVAGAYLAEETVAELFAGPQVPVIAGQGLRAGRALPEAGGHSLSGEWSFASAVKHASHIHTGGAVEPGGELRIFVVPIEQVTLIDNWDVLGLRATGSLDYAIDSVFVPDGYSHPTAIKSSPRGGTLYRLGIPGIAAICHSGWAIGVGRRLLEELAALAQAKGRAGRRAVRERQLPRGLCGCGGQAPRCPGADLRDLGRRAGDARGGRPAERRPAEPDSPRPDQRDALAAGDRELRLPRRRHDRAACGHGPAALPRRPRRHPARDLLAAGAKGLRPPACGLGDGRGLGTARPRSCRLIRAPEASVSVACRRRRARRSCGGAPLRGRTRARRPG